LKIFFVFLFGFLSSGLRAQSPAEDVFRYPLEAKNTDAFTTTCARLAEHPFITGNFEQEKYLSRLDRSLKSSGAFIITADMGMVWDTAKPFPSTLTLGKDYLIQSRPGGQKTVLGAQGNETFIRMAEVLSAVFSGRSQGLLDNFEVYYSGSPAAWELGLSPREKAIGSFAEKIIMRGDTAIKSIMIYEQSGDTIRYILSNHRYPAELSAHEKDYFSLP
jgi:hypothetical protein